jgi:hypothetical protein
MFKENVFGNFIKYHDYLFDLAGYLAIFSIRYGELVLTAEITMEHTQQNILGDYRQKKQGNSAQEMPRQAMLYALITLKG